MKNLFFFLFSFTLLSVSNTLSADSPKFLGQVDESRRVFQEYSRDTDFLPYQLYIDMDSNNKKYFAGSVEEINVGIYKDIIIFASSGSESIQVYDSSTDTHYEFDQRFYEDTHKKIYYDAVSISNDLKNFKVSYTVDGPGFDSFCIYETREVYDIVKSGDGNRILNNKNCKDLDNYFNFKWLENGEIQYFKDPGDMQKILYANDVNLGSEEIVSVSSENNTSFTDLSTSNSLYNQVMQAVEDGWINGYPDNTIQLEKTVNRAEFAKMLMLAFSQNDGDTTALQTFPDVDRGAWYAPVLAKAVELKLMKGYPDGNMRPGNTINAAEALKMTLAMTGETMPVVKGEWYEPYRQFAQENMTFITLDLASLDMATPMARGQCIDLINAMK